MLGNAATFHLLASPAASVDLLRRAVEAAPGVARWYAVLGSAYDSLAFERPELWANASAAYERFLAHEPDLEKRWPELDHAARAATRAGQFEAARGAGLGARLRQALAVRRAR